MSAVNHGEFGAARQRMLSSMISVVPLDNEELPPAQLTLMVACNSAVCREQLALHLRTAGYFVVTSSDSEEALATLASLNFDAVLLDLTMPHRGGYETLLAMRRRAALREVPVLILSASDEVAQIVRCFEAGAEDYLPKPINPVVLLARLGGCLQRKRALDRARVQTVALQAERARADRLLLSILPQHVVDRLKAGELGISDAFANATVLFADLTDFTKMSAGLTPQQLIEVMNLVFSRFDELAAKFGVEKIKTIGDCYMAAGGVPNQGPNDAADVLELAQAMLNATEDLRDETGQPLHLRIGVHSGPVVAGIVGTTKFAYDLWGDTVNVASRLETQGVIDRVHVSKQTFARVGGRFRFEPRGPIELKGKGWVETFLLLP